MNKKEFLTALKPIEVITGKAFTEDQINIYFMLISKTPLETFQKGILKLCTERKFTNIPTPAEILEYCNGTKLDITSKSIIASNTLRKAIKEVGKYESVAFDDYLIHKIIKTSYGSWVKICNTTLEELEIFLKWDFPKLYSVYSNYKNLDDIPIYLTGVAESSNKHLENDNTIKYIGDKQKALKWQIRLSEKVSVDKEKLIRLGFDKCEKIENKTKKIDIKELIDKNKDKFKVVEKEKVYKEVAEKTQEQLKEEIKLGVMI